MANIRVKDLPNTNAANDNDEFIVDSSTSGTRRLSYSELKSEISTDFQGDVNTYKIATLASDNKLDPSQIPDTLSQGLNFVGVANSAGDLTSTTQGDFYVIQTAFDSYQVGDQAVYNGSSYTRVTDGTKQIAEGGTGATTLDAAKVNLEIANVGTDPSEVPLNQHLGDLAYQSSEAVSIDKLEVTDKIDLSGAPTQQLEVYGDAPTVRVTDTSDPVGFGESIGKIEFYGNDGSSGGVGVRAIIDTVSEEAAGNRYGLAISTSANNASPVEHIRVAANGNTGLGTSTPGGKLTIETGSGNGLQLYRSAANANFDAITFRDTTNSATNGRIGFNANELRLEGTNEISLNTGGSERAVIDSSGRVGLGTSSPGSYHSSADDLVIGDGSQDRGITIASATNKSGGLYFADGTTGDDRLRGYLSYNHYANALRLGVNAATQWEINSSGNLVAYAAGVGIDFGSGAILDDYETGTATVAFSSGGGSVTINPSNNTIRYIKVGKLVHIHGEIAVSSVSSPTGDLQITGLPFPSASVGGYNRSTVALHPSTLNAATELAGFVENNSSSIVVRVSGGTTSGGTAATVIRANTAFVIGGTYESAT